MGHGAILDHPHQSDPYGARLVLLVPKACVKEVKTSLEHRRRFDRYHGISPEVTPKDASDVTGQGTERRMCVPTTIPHSTEDGETNLNLTKSKLLAELHLDHLLQHVTLSSWNPSTIKTPVAVEHNPLRKAVREALNTLPSDTVANLRLTIDILVLTFPDAYSVYKPLLLLPSNSVGSPWNAILSQHTELFQSIWQHIAAALHCTHIALNSPIPPSNTSDSAPAHAHDNSNVLRSPVNLTPIYGSFGPAPTSNTLLSPTLQDLNATLWVHTTQNGIHQTWAPLYTMFSRGNIKEKSRILHLPSVVAASNTKTGATAVDLYAGIGYFAFSYRKARTRRVLCWELNPWSVEGLRRGAALNNWTSRVWTGDDVPSHDAAAAVWEVWREDVVRGTEDFWIFHMSNETAGRILQCLTPHVPPVRHVNLGLLPRSRLAWPTAVGALDAELGGWVHAHENVGVREMEVREGEVQKEFQRLVGERKGAVMGAGAERGGVTVQVEHVERVKMYAPGVVHAVFDVRILGKCEVDG